MDELDIPDDAIQIVADHCFGRLLDDGSVRYEIGREAALDIASAALDDAASLIVAAELRRCATVLGLSEIDAVVLQCRADQLDPTR